MSISEGANALLEEELLSGPAIGIARVIAATDSLAGLTEKQKDVYEKFIAPHFRMTCTTEDCPFEIEIDAIADAIRAEAAGDSVFCRHCQYIGEQNAKDN